MAALGILGGTFDPVHCGHLRLALEMRERLRLDKVRLMPALNPRLRDRPVADAQLRLRMLDAAVASTPELEVDARELERPGPTTTVETLETLRAELPDTPLVLVLGMDAFSRLDGWHRWTELLGLCHLAIAGRTGAGPPGEGQVADLLRAHRADTLAALQSSPAGCIHVADIPRLDISATDIRRRLGAGRNVRCLVPGAVQRLIAAHGIYTHAK